MASRPGRYDNVTAKVVGNIRWALAKSGYSPDIVSDLWEPWENEMESEGCGETGTVVGDDFHGQHLKTDIVQLLTSGELYTRICSRLGLPTQHRGAGSGGPIRWGQVMGESSRAHWAVISALSRRRFYPSEGPDYPITASDLTQTPIRTWSHVALMDTLMEFNCQSLCPTRLSISAASRLSPTPRAPMAPHNPSWEDALLHWVNMVVCKAYKDRDAEPPSVQSIEDLSDGRALLAVIEHYTKPLDRHTGSSVSECLCLLEDTAQSLIGRTWHLTRADWLLSSNRLKVNMLTCVAEIFHALDGEKEEQEKEQEKQEKEKESDSSPPHTNSSSPLSSYHDDVTDPDKSLESENEVRVAKHNGQEDISSQLSWSSEVMGSSRKVTAGNRITRDNPVVSPGMACKTGNDATEVTNGLHDDEFSAAVTRLNTEVLKRQKELDELVITATVLGQKDGVDLSQNLEILNNRAREVGTEVTRLLKKQKEVMEMWGTGLEQGRGHGRGQGRVPARLLRRMGRGREPQNLKATHGRQAVLSVSTPDLRTGAGESLMKPTVSSLQRSRLRPAKSSGNLLLPELRMPVKSSSQSRLHLGRDSKLTDARSRRSNSPAKTLHRRGRAGDGAERSVDLRKRAEEDGNSMEQYNGLNLAPAPRRFGPSKGSNRQLIANALTHCCLPCPSDSNLRNQSLQALTVSDAPHFLLLLRAPSCRFRALYAMWPLTPGPALRLVGNGPVTVWTEMDYQTYKYSSAQKTFHPALARSLSQAIDAFSL